MDLSIASILLLDGLTNGAIYALLGMCIVLVFAVTRVIFIPQGEFVAYGALTLAIFQTGKVPGTVWLLLILAAVAALSWPRFGAIAATPCRRCLQRRHGVAYQSLAGASTLVLLIVSVGVHFAMTGLGLLFFGAEGSRTPAFSEARVDLGGVPITGQSMVVVGPIKRPESAPIAAASPKLNAPALCVEMPISRAPKRLTAVARNALP